MTTTAVAGALSGLLASSGLLLLIGFFSSRQFRLEDRLAPYLVDFDQETRFLGLEKVSSPLGVWSKAVEPFVDRMDGFLAILTSSQEVLEQRIYRAGIDKSTHEYRIAQLQWAIAGLTTGAALATLVALRNSFDWLPSLAMIVLSPVLALILQDYLLNASIKRRQHRILSEFPTVAEILALSVSCGEGPLLALERISTSGTGALAQELGATVSHVRAGMGIGKALENLGQRTGVDHIARFADGVSVAVERGTPLAQVLKSQARDARDMGHRELMELGGKKELMMLVPVVFFVLPITVVFAIFPSMSLLDVGF